MADIRFGVASADGTPGSTCWKVRPSAGDQDVYVTDISERKWLHASLHASGEWHFKLILQGKTYVFETTRPPPLDGGFIHAFRITAPRGYDSGRKRGKPERVQWCEAKAAFIVFDVMLEEAGSEGGLVSSPIGGPQLVGRAPLAKGGAVVVMMDGTDHVPSGPPIGSDLMRKARKRFAGAPIPHVAWGWQEPGTLLLRYGYGERIGGQR